MRIPDSSKELLSLIQKKGPFTKNDLLELTQLKLTSLNRLLKPLFDANYILNNGCINETGGRPSALIDVNEKDWAIIGIDISRTYINLVVTTLKMRLIDQTRFQLDESSPLEATLQLVCQKINSIKKKYTSRCILGIGIGMIGPFDKQTGALPNLESMTGLSVILESGANLALLSEHFFGDARHYENVAYINCGVGIRSSAMLSNKLLSSKNSREDALAHMLANPDGLLCSCGQKGCIEAYSSIFSILKQYKEATDEAISYMDFLDKAHRGNSICLPILDRAAYVLGIGLANYIRALNLHYVILSGPLVQHSTYFYNRVLSTVLTHVGNAFNDGVLFNKGGSFEHNSIAIGGAACFFESLLGSESLYK